MYQRLRDYNVPAAVLDEIFSNEKDLKTMEKSWIELNENINTFLMQKSLKDVLNSRRDNPEEKDDFLIATG